MAIPGMQVPSASAPTESPLAGTLDQALAALVNMGPQAMRDPRIERAVLLALDGKALGRSTPAKQMPNLMAGPQPPGAPSPGAANVDQTDRAMIMQRIAQAAQSGAMPGPQAPQAPNPALIAAMRARQGAPGPQGPGMPAGAMAGPAAGGMDPRLQQLMAAMAARRGIGGAVGAV